MGNVFVIYLCPWLFKELTIHGIQDKNGKYVFSNVICHIFREKKPGFLRNTTKAIRALRELYAQL